MEKEKYTAILFDFLNKLDTPFSMECEGKMTKKAWLSTWEAAFHGLNKAPERNLLLENILLLCAEALSRFYGLDDFLGTRPTVYQWWELIGSKEGGKND